MLKNYLLVAYRNFRRHAGFGLMNVAGLAVGIAACLFILLYVQDELTFDRKFPDSDRIYRVVEARRQADGAEQHFVYTAGPMAAALEASVPDVERAAGVITSWSLGRFTVERGEARFYVGDHMFAGPEFFEIFDFEVVRGTADVDEPLEVVLTEDAALQYFGDENPLGQTLTTESLGVLTVTGVLEPPENSHLGFSMIISHASLLQFEDFIEQLLGTWRTSSSLTFVKLREGADPQAVERKMAELAAANFDEDNAARRTPYLQALTDVHFGSGHIQFDRNRNPGRIAYVYIFSAAALFVLLIACINYMNMATARSLRRAREIGMRKVVGAGRSQLVAQFLSESLLTAVIAFAVALLIVWAALPWFNDLADKAVSFATLVRGPLLLAAAAIAVLVGLVAGSYPAFFLSRLRPVGVLKGTANTRRGAAAIRRGLVVSQFVLSIILITATLVVRNQLHFFQSKPLGFDEEQLVVVDINSGDVRTNFQAVKDEMLRVPAVRSVSVSSRVPGDWKDIPQVDVRRTGASNDDIMTAHFLGVDEDFMDTYRIPLVDGRGFSGKIDSAAVLVNETAARMLGTAAGDRLVLPESDFEATVIGTVNDFHYRSLHDEIGPMILGYRANPVQSIDYFTVRFEGADVQATLAGLRAVGERFDPMTPFEYNFLDARLADYYANEQRVRRIFSVAAAIAIMLACLGLFGLSAYMAERRTKEIGVRKVLGATSVGIMAMLTSDFARLIVLSFIIAAPLSYLAMEWWLREFPYRVAVGVGTLAISGVAALGVAVLTVSYQALKAARTNPAECLQYE